MGRDLFRRRDPARTLGYRDSRAIYARLVLRPAHRVDPGEEIGSLFSKEPPTLFLIEKQNRPGGKAFPLGSGDGGRCVGAAQGRGIFAPEFLIQAPVVQNHEAKTVGLKHSAFAGPAIAICARRVVQPITGVGEAAMKSGEQIVPRVVVLVEAEV